MLKRFAKSSLPIGLDLSGRWFKAAQASARGGVCAKAKITRGSEPGGKGVTSANAVLTAADAQVLAGALERSGFRGNRVTVVAPRNLLYAEILELPPRASGAPLEKLARVELARSNRCEESSFTLGMWDVPLGPGRGVGGRDPHHPTQVFAVGLPNDRIEPVLAALEAADLEVVAVDSPGCALARACAGLMAAREAGTSVEGRPLTVLLDIGWGGALLVVVANSEMGRVVVYERSIAEAGLHGLFAAVASRLGVGEQEVELILAGAGSGVAALQAESRVCVAEYLDSLGPELQRSLSYVAHRYPGCAPLCVLVTGDGAEMTLGAALCERLSQSVQVPVVRVGLADVAGGEASGLGAHSSLISAAGASMHGACEAGRAAA